ncbi:tetratricopeptide repeat protein [Verrucomicrobium spinosum]|uniref:tetratricopeptide repeat protein n=1 Tax=Verrucomicrobium spinosum TaxID=2736 RepID=UPI00094681C0|nr:tetratricopeptide repeat protein [Verrucomicrobium spinosum]
MIVQVLNGETLHVYRVLAYGLIEPRELMAHLREVWQARPDLWEAWSVLISQTQDAGELEEAARLAEEASRRFPLLPGAWRDLGQIMRLQGRNEESLRAFRRTTELNPDWDQAWQDLAQLQEDLGQAEDALHTLRTALKRMPRENNLRMLLAIFLWRAGERQEPWELVESCLRDDPACREPGGSSPPGPPSCTASSLWRIWRAPSPASTPPRPASG